MLILHIKKMLFIEYNCENRTCEIASCNVTPMYEERPIIDIIFDKAINGLKILYFSLSMARKMMNNKGKHKKETEQYQDKL